jgi:hypothetical protein
MGRVCTLERNNMGGVCALERKLLQNVELVVFAGSKQEDYVR